MTEPTLLSSRRLNLMHTGFFSAYLGQMSREITKLKHFKRKQKYNANLLFSRLHKLIIKYLARKTHIREEYKETNKVWQYTVDILMSLLGLAKYFLVGCIIIYIIYYYSFEQARSIVSLVTSKCALTPEYISCYSLQ